MENKQYWGVCVGEGKDMKIVKVYSDEDVAIQEAMFFTHETQTLHTIQPVIKKK
jgi:hypothetical protein